MYKFLSNCNKRDVNCTYTILTGCNRCDREGNVRERSPELSGEERPWNTSKPGEWLCERFLQYGCSSINQFVSRAKSEPQLRALVFQRNFEALARKAFVMAQNEVREMSFFELCKKAYESEQVYMKYDQCLSVKDSYTWLLKILIHNNIAVEDFVFDIFNIVDKRKPKINTLMVIGPPNAGKTLVVESVAKACIFTCNIQRFSKGQNFTFMDAVGTRVCMINEPRFTDEYVETLKNILEGLPCTVEVKFQVGQMLERTPVLITSNHGLGMYIQHGRQTAEAAFDARMIKYTFKPFEELKHCNGHLNPGVWYMFMNYMLRAGYDILNNITPEQFSSLPVGEIDF